MAGGAIRNLMPPHQALTARLGKYSGIINYSLDILKGVYTGMIDKLRGYTYIEPDRFNQDLAAHHDRVHRDLLGD